MHFDAMYCLLYDMMICKSDKLTNQFS